MAEVRICAITEDMGEISMSDWRVFRERLKGILEKRGMTQTELARIINEAPNTISRYINGWCAPAISTLYRICTVLDVSDDYLIGLKGDDTNESET